jgi:hypothetical protein
MGEKTVVHIFAEEFIEINRAFLSRAVSVQGGEILLLCCFTAVVLICVSFSFFFSLLREICLLNFRLVFID